MRAPSSQPIQAKLCDVADQSDSVEFQFDQAPSPLMGLLHSFAASPYRIAPERTDELRVIAEKYKFRIRLDFQNPDWRFEEFRMASYIMVSHRTLERLWAYCYAFSCIVTELQKTAGEGGSKIKNPGEFGMAFRLLKWAKQEELAERECGWPAELPSPENLTLEHVSFANHIFLMMSGRILLHEFAHAILEHTGGDSNQMIAEEFEADGWADSWILSRWTEYKTDEKVFTGRALGIVASHIPALIFGARNKVKSKSHPRSIDRLIKFASIYYPTANPTKKLERDYPCAFAFAVIVILLAEQGYIVNVEEMADNYPELFTEFREYFT